MTGSDQYFNLLDQLLQARSQKRYTQALNLSLQGVDLLPQLVKSEVRECGRWSIPSLPPLAYACRYLAALKRRDDLVRIRAIVLSVPQLKDWIAEVDRALADADIMDRIEALLLENPGFPQANLGKKLGINGRDASNMMLYAEQIGVVRRDKEDKGYRLYLQNEGTR